MTLPFRDAVRNIARPLSVLQAGHDLLFQIGMINDFLALVLCIFPPDVRFVLRFQGKIPPLNLVSPDLLRDRVRTPFHECRNAPKGVLLFQKPFDLPPIALSELLPRFVFFIPSFSHFAGRLS